MAFAASRESFHASFSAIFTHCKLDSRWRQSCRVHFWNQVEEWIPRSNKRNEVEDRDEKENVKPKSRIGGQFRKSFGGTIGIDRV
mmetsp:Transcript_11127/g.26234  ORF Transcript_11127/g.26234 Transcript_11127/m.26234 type:complete len:85 (+) Transcript_11127:682-936(+)